MRWSLVAGVARLRTERNAVILAHNYRLPAIQDLADFVGDSLQLAQQAAATTAELIVFCGVHFMAETAAIISPDKRVLIPDPAAGCSLADSITAPDVRAWRAEHPGAVVVAYVNTDADVKAEADYCCTSANAVAIVDAIPADREILFLPDRFLGAYVERRTGRRMQLWPGECHVHASIALDDVDRLTVRHPQAHLLLHPECGCVDDVLLRLAADVGRDQRTFVLSTGGMARHASGCRSEVDLVGTEAGMLHRLAKLYRALRDDVYEVKVRNRPPSGHTPPLSGCSPSPDRRAVRGRIS